MGLMFRVVVVEELVERDERHKCRENEDAKTAYQIAKNARDSAQLVSKVERHKGESHERGQNQEAANNLRDCPSRVRSHARLYGGKKFMSISLPFSSGGVFFGVSASLPPRK